MTINQQPKVPMHAVKSSANSGASQGARRATEGRLKMRPDWPHRMASPACPKKTGRLAGQSDRQHRDAVMAAARELTPVLGAGAACRVLGLARGA